MAMTLHSPRRRPASVPVAALLASSLLAAAAVAAPVAAPSPAAPATTASRSVTEAARPGKEGSNAAQLQRWIEQSAPMTWSGGGDSLLDQSTDPPSAAPHPTRVKVSVGRLDDNPRLAPCARMEPFLPPNTRLWGRTHVGVRCIEGASWSTYVPVTVSVFGRALVADLPLPAGALADPKSFRIDEVELTAARGLPVSDPAMLAGRTLGRSLSAGAVLRADDLRVPQTVSAGDPVRIRLIGQGFTISSEGFAVVGGGEGQALKVHTGQGKLLVGTVRGQVVEIRL